MRTVMDIKQEQWRQEALKNAFDRGFEECRKAATKIATDTAAALRRDAVQEGDDSLELCATVADDIITELAALSSIATSPKDLRHQVCNS